MDQRTGNKLSRLFALLLLTFPFAAGTALLGDGFIVIPRPPRTGAISPFPLEVVRHDVQVEISDLLATTTVDQEFFNPNSFQLEGYYLFPLPAGATIKNFSMWIDGRETAAELLDAAKARSIYEDIVRRLRDPALLEYDGRGVFKVRIFPIEAHARKKIRIAYHEALEKDNGAIGYRYPLNTEKFSAKAIESVRISLTVESTVPLAAIHCPTHPVTVTRRGVHRAMVIYESRNSLPDSDFQLFITPEAGPLGFSLLTYREKGQDGVFFLSISPGRESGADAVSARDIIFVMDTSGSMAGRSLEQAKSALRYCLGRLRHGDRFNIVRFATEAEPLFGTWRPAAAENLRQAENFIDQWRAAGGTNCDEAMDLALRVPDEGAGMPVRPARRPGAIVLITDGKPTIGETAEETLLSKIDRANHGRFKIFPVAIGSDINTHLLDKLAEQTRTFRTYIAATENIENGIARFFDKIQSPVLSSLRLSVSGNVRVNQLYPHELPDLYKGSTLTVCGRYQGSGPAAVEVTGRLNGRLLKFTFQADFPAQDQAHDFLTQLWAARRIGFLLDQIRLHGESRELVDEVTRLARLHGIVTPFTSYLILEDEKQRGQRGDLAESDMTLGRVAAANPAFAQKQRQEFTRMKEDKSGSSGVQVSEELQALHQAQTIAETRPGENRLAYRDPADREQRLNRQVRQVRGRTFFLSGDTWVDAAAQSIPALPLTRIAFASAAYFTWLEKEPSSRPFLALGRSLKFVWEQRIIEIY